MRDADRDAEDVVDGSGPGGVERAVRERLAAAHADLIDGVAAAADGVLAPGETTRERPAGALRDRLADAGLLGRAADALPDLVAAAGRSLPAEPVPAPPYVVVTGEGLTCRATLADGRLVVTLRTFEVVRAGGEADDAPGAAYRRLDRPAGATVDADADASDGAAGSGAAGDVAVAVAFVA